MRVVVGDGKYTILFDETTGALEAQRYGQKWRDLTGDGMVLAMLQEIQVLREAIGDIMVTNTIPSNDFLKRLMGE
jgi:hypothetical protein